MISSLFYVSTSITFPYFMYNWHFWDKKNYKNKVFGVIESIIGAIVVILASYVSIISYFN